MNEPSFSRCRTFLFACLLAWPGLNSFAAEESPLPAGTEIRPLADLGKHGTPPQAISRVAPVYPRGLVSSGIEGQVSVDFVITPEGKVVNPVVVQSNNPWLERPALEAILQWKFKPGRVDGRPVYVQAHQLLEFEIDSASGHPLWSVRKGKDFEKLPPEFQWSKPPEPIATAYPVYPLAALQAGQKGIVKVVFIVTPRGEVRDAEVAEAATPELDAAVLAMLDTWSFAPAAKKDKTPCYAGMSLQFNFQPYAGRGDVPVSDEMIQILKDLKEAPAKIVPIGELDAKIRPLSRRPPVYPSVLRSAGQEGEATVEFYIDRHGDAQLPHIVRSSAPQFGYAAVQAVATWRFEAPKKNGKSVTALARITLGFTMKPGADTPAGEKKAPAPAGASVP